MIVLQIEIDDGNDQLIDVKATKYLPGDPTHEDAMAFLRGEKVLLATSVEGMVFLDRNELFEVAVQLLADEEGDEG